jgi:hypothetical protein
VNAGDRQSINSMPACLRHVVDPPPVALLLRWIGELERAGITVALGGSGLLAALGLGDRVRDWDLTTDAPFERVVAALGDAPHRAFGSDAIHADRKLALADGALEVIVGFAFHGPSGPVHIPTRVSARPDGIPLGSPEGWAVAYHLLGRAAKAESLLGYLSRRGVDPAALAAMLGQPIPAGLAARLRALPTSRTT